MGGPSHKSMLSDTACSLVLFCFVFRLSMWLLVIHRVSTSPDGPSRQFSPALSLAVASADLSRLLACESGCASLLVHHSAFPSDHPIGRRFTRRSSASRTYRGGLSRANGLHPVSPLSAVLPSLALSAVRGACQANCPALRTRGCGTRSRRCSSGCRRPTVDGTLRCFTSTASLWTPCNISRELLSRFYRRSSGLKRTMHLQDAHANRTQGQRQGNHL